MAETGITRSGPVMVGDLALPFAKAVKAGPTIYVSGAVGFDDRGALVGGGVAGQTRRAIEIIGQSLAEFDCGLEHVVKVTAWLDDARDFGAYNKVFREMFGAHLPARSTVEARLMVDAKVELEAIAYVA